MSNIICTLFGHKYRLKRKITSNIREIKCIRCFQEFGMNDELRAVLPLDDELKEAHNSLISINTP